MVDQTDLSIAGLSVAPIRHHAVTDHRAAKDLDGRVTARPSRALSGASAIAHSTLRGIGHAARQCGDSGSRAAFASRCQAKIRRWDRETLLP